MNPIQKACDEIRSMTPTNWWAAHGQHVEQVIGEAVGNQVAEVSSALISKNLMTEKAAKSLSEFRDARIQELEAAIKETVTQRLDHICWLDVYQKLAKLVGVEFDPLLLPPEALHANCGRFIESIYVGLGYTPDRLTQYVETLEKRLAVAEECFSKIRELSLRGFEIDKVAKEFLSERETRQET